MTGGSNYGIYAQLYNADGTPAGAKFVVNTTTGRNQGRSTVDSFSDGGFVIAWQSNLQDGSSDGVFGQRFHADGSFDGPEFQINTFTTGNQWAPSLTVLSDDGFVVTWQSSGQDGSVTGVYGQRYHADGTPAGAEFLINTTTQGQQANASVTAMSGGRFVVVWDSYVSATDQADVFGQY